MNEAFRHRFLTQASGYSFYNTSVYTFDTLLADPANIETNFRAYLNSFSDNMLDILANFKFDVEISTLADKTLHKAFTEERDAKIVNMAKNNSQEMFENSLFIDVFLDRVM